MNMKEHIYKATSFYFRIINQIDKQPQALHKLRENLQQGVLKIFTITINSNSNKKIIIFIS